MLDTQAEPTTDDAPELETKPEVLLAANKVQLGITYSETCTLESALDSYTAHFGSPGNNREEFLASRGGEFTFRRPSALEAMRMNVEIDRLAQGADLSVFTQAQLRAYVTCKHLLTKAPAWFKLEEEAEVDVFLLLHHWYSEWSRSFRGGLVAPQG